MLQKYKRGNRQLSTNEQECIIRDSGVIEPPCLFNISQYIFFLKGWPGDGSMRKKFPFSHVLCTHDHRRILVEFLGKKTTSKGQTTL